MDNQKAKMLGENLAHYKRMQENGTVDIIEFHTTDGQKFGIGNVAAIQLLLSVTVTELERQFPGRLVFTAFLQSFRNVAETLPYFHKTLEQAFFRVMKACIIGMAKREPSHIDGRNRAAYEMCRMLAPMLEDTALPFI